MKLKTGISYNMDALCFLNIMTADEMYVAKHKEAFDKWYPQLSDEIKLKMRNVVAARGNAMLSPIITLFISSLGDFNSRNLIELLGSFQEIESSMDKNSLSF